MILSSTDPLGLNYWINQFGEGEVTFAGCIFGGILFGSIIGYCLAKMESGKNNEPKTGDTNMLSFICGCYSILATLKTFTKDYQAYIDSLDNLFGKDGTIEFFHRYLVKMSNNGFDICNRWYVANVNTFTREDDDKARATIVATFEKKFFVFGNLDFVEAVGKIVEHVEKYLEEQKEFIVKLTTDDKDAMLVLKKLEQLVKNGKDFVDSFNDNDTVADSDNADQVDTTSETFTADNDKADNTFTDNFVVV